MTYERILRDKTASLFAWATRTGAYLGGGSEVERTALGSFGERLGIAFQLVDDVLDYAGTHTGKTLFADLREGKLTLPLVLAVAKDPSLQDQLRKIHAGDEGPVQDVSERVIASGVCSEVRRRAKEVTERAVEELRRVRPSPSRQLLEDVALQLTNRAG
jgi:octaprenyl-diphosphate synthase